MRINFLIALHIDKRSNLKSLANYMNLLSKLETWLPHLWVSNKLSSLNNLSLFNF